MLHDEVHLLLGNRDTAAGARFSVAEAVQEYRRTFAGCTVLIIADVKAILIFVLIIEDMLAVIFFRSG